MKLLLHQSGMKGPSPAWPGGAAKGLNSPWEAQLSKSQAQISPVAAQNQTGELRSSFGLGHGGTWGNLVYKIVI